jgi:hypothetical protein
MFRNQIEIKLRKYASLFETNTTQNTTTAHNMEIMNDLFHDELLIDSITVAK